MDNKNLQLFFELVKAGLWSDGNPDIRIDGTTDWQGGYRLATEQSVLGLVLAGLEHSDLKPPKELLLQWIGEVQMIEQRNKKMNTFIAELIEELRKADVYTLLVKGQGVAQCYGKPLWRSPGDVDLYLSRDNYDKAKTLLLPLAQRVENEDMRRLHLGMTIDKWVVELHGTMYTKISRKMNNVSDEVHKDLFYNGNIRSWNNNGVQVFLPSADNDAIIVFNHFVNHFYGEGVGLRQICDWCRLLWTYKDSLNHKLLKQRICREGLMTEWKAFAAFAVDFLGMPVEAMPFYEDKPFIHRKAKKICKLVIETGNFGQNKDKSYRKNYTRVNSYFVTAWKRFKEFARIATIFPVNAPKFYLTYVINRLNTVL